MSTPGANTKTIRDTLRPSSVFIPKANEPVLVVSATGKRVGVVYGDGTNQIKDLKFFQAEQAEPLSKGVATPATNPTNPVEGDVWLAHTSNLDTVYPNFTNLNPVSVVNGKHTINNRFVRSSGTWVLMRELVEVNTIGVGTVTPEKTTFIKEVISKNKYNKNATDHSTYGFYIASGTGASTAALPAYPNYWHSGYIPVVAGGQITVSHKDQFAWYNANKVYITGDAVVNSAGATLTPPANAAFVRFTIPGNADKTGIVSTFQVEAGNQKTVYEAYKNVWVLTSTEKPIESDALTKELEAALTANINAALTVTTSKVASKAITPEKVSFLQKGKNLFNVFDPDLSAHGFYINASGVILAASPGDPNYYVSPFIPVQPSTQYTVSYKHILVWYNASKAVITGDSSTNAAGATVTSPVNAAFFRITIPGTASKTGAIATFQVEQGAAKTDFEAYGFRLRMEDGSIISTEVALNQVREIFQKHAVRPATLAIAPKLYTLAGKELQVYSENIHKFYLDYRGKTQYDLNASGIGSLRQTGRAGRYATTGAGTLTASVSVSNEEFDFDILFKMFSVIVANTSSTNAVKILNVGDSFTQTSSFTDILRTVAGSGVSFLGIRKSEGVGVTNQPHQGTNGWKLGDYFTHSTTHLSPFMHPAGSYIYLGNTAHWKTAHVDGSGLTRYMDSIVGLFSSSTGYKNNPSVNELMYDNTQAKYFAWNGSAWVEVAANTLTFSFNFTKYLQAWSIAAPNIVHVLLGTNDFISLTETQVVTAWAEWETQMNQFIAGVKSAVPGVKVVVGVPVSSGRLGVDGNRSTERRKRAYWLHANNLIATYANREGESIYLADYHSCIDREFGFASSDDLPFPEYTGAARERFQSDTIHCGADGWKQMGNIYAGIIQHLR